MRGCANCLVGIIFVCGWFWVLGIGWGLGMAALFGLLAIANGNSGRPHG